MIIFVDNEFGSILLDENEQTTRLIGMATLPITN